MKMQSWVAVAGALMLAGCGSQAGKEEESKPPAKSSAPAKAGVKLQPGEWEMTMETLDVEAKGLPAGVASGMMPPKHTSRTCLTAEEVNDPKADMLGGEGQANCTQEGFEWAGGKISGTTTCTGQDGIGKTVIAMDGRYGSTEMDVNMKMNTDASGAPLTLETRITGRRVGDCPAGKKG